MLIDDNKIDLFIHNEFIRKMNIANSVMQYSFAKEALEFLQSNDSSKWPDLILLDIHMPIMNGFDFLEEYRELPLQSRQKCNVVIVSSSLDTGDKVKAKENAFVLELFEKPLNISKLMDLLTQNNIV
jgi:response regulator of citrate/malate metabolism